MTRLRHILVFLGIFAVILAGTHIYMFERISYYLQLTGAQDRLLGVVLGGFAVLTIISLPASRLLPRAAASLLSWIVFPWMGIALLLFTTLLATDVIWLTFMLTAAADHLPEPSVLLQRCFGVVSLSLTAFLIFFALWKGLRPVVVKPLTIHLKRLPPALNGFRIVQITDLHIGPLIGGSWLKKIVERINGLKPDLVVITGDLVDGSVAELRHHVAPLADLKAKHGVYFITGNHEYYSGVEAWCEHITSLGLHVLRNQRVSIPAGAGDENSFDLVGVNDWMGRQFPSGGPDLPKALLGRDPSKALILLAHQPAAVEEASTFGVDLQLSGHTHAGQIWPFTYLVHLQQPYRVGLHRHKKTGTQIYVSPGTGFWGPPMRLGTAAEITLITLQSGD